MSVMGSVVFAVLVAPAASPLPEGGGDPGKAYREYYHALIARDWKTLHRVSTPFVFQNMSYDPRDVPPANVELTLSGTSDGRTATLKVRTEDKSTGDSSESAQPMRLQAGQWRVSRGDFEKAPGAPVLAFEPAETLRRMHEVYAKLEFVRSESEDHKVPKDLAVLVAHVLGRTDLHLSDAWGTPFAYRVHPTREGYLLISFGADGKPDADVYDAAGVPKSLDRVITTDPNADIVVGSGQLYFLRYPQGTMLWVIHRDYPRTE